MNPQRIIKKTCRAFSITQEDLDSTKRGIVSQARAVICWCLVNHCGMSRQDVSFQLWGRRDMHSSVIGGIQRVENGCLDEIAKDRGYANGIALANSILQEVPNQHLPLPTRDKYLRPIMVSPKLLLASSGRP